MNLESRLFDQMKIGNFIAKFSILSDETGITRGRAKYGFHELCKMNGAICKLFDHVSEYHYYDKEVDDIGSILVTNPYLDISMTIDYISKNIPFISHCIKYKYDISIYKDTDINFYPGTTMVVFKCSDVKIRDDRRYQPLDELNVKIYYGQSSLRTDKPEVLKIGTVINHSCDNIGELNIMIDEEKRENFEKFLKEYDVISNADIRGKNVLSPFNRHGFKFGVSLEYITFNSTKFFNTKNKKQIMVVVSYLELAHILQTFCCDYRFITYCIENGIEICIHHRFDPINYTDGYMIVFRPTQKPKYTRTTSGLYGIFGVKYYDENSNMKIINIKPSFNID